MIDNAIKLLGIGLGARLELIEYYNAHCYGLVRPNRKYRIKPSDDWCAMFTSVVAHKAGLGVDVFPYEVSVYYQCQLAKEWGSYTENPDYIHEGDLVVYDWGVGNRYNHVGIVVECSGELIKVIEGNFRGTVGYRTVNRRSSQIRGFIQIDSMFGGSDPDPRLVTIANDVIRGRYGSGDVRKRLLGADYETVQIIVNRILNGK